MADSQSILRAAVLPALRAFLRQHPGLAGASVVLALVLTVMGDVLMPHLYGRIVTAIEGGPGRAVLRRVRGPAVATVAAFAAISLGWIVKDWLNARCTPLLEGLVREHMAATLLLDETGPDLGGEAAAPAADLSEERHAGAFVSSIARTPDVATWWATSVVDYIAPYLVALLWTAGYLWRRDPWLAVLLVLVAAVVGTMLVASPAVCEERAAAREAAIKALHEHTDDVVRNLAAVRASDAGPAELARIRDLNARFGSAHRSSVRCMLALRAPTAVVLVLFLGAVLLRCCQLVGRRRMTIGGFVATFTMTTGLVATLGWIAALTKGAVMDYGMLTTRPEGDQRERERERDGEGAAGEPSPAQERSTGGGHRGAAPPGQGIGLWRAAPWGRAPDRARPTTLDCPPRELTVLRGPVGSGKSTALRMMAGLVPLAPGGDAYAGGRWFRDLPRRAVRRAVAYMPQDTTLLDRSVLDNIAYGPGWQQLDAAAAEAAVMAGAAELGLDGFLRSLRAGLATPAGKGGSKLSGGQRALVWFLRVALRRPAPAYLLLDEPTAAMDAASHTLFEAAVERLKARMTVVMVTHDTR